MRTASFCAAPRSSGIRTCAGRASPAGWRDLHAAATGAAAREQGNVRGRDLCGTSEWACSLAHPEWSRWQDVNGRDSIRFVVIGVPETFTASSRSSADHRALHAEQRTRVCVAGVSRSLRWQKGKGTMAIMQRRVIIPFITLSLLLGPRAALAQGTLLWQQTLNGTANGDDKAFSVAVDTKGTCSPPASPRIPAPVWDFTVAKFAPDGTLLWRQTLNGTANSDDGRCRWRWTPKATCSPPATPRIPAPAGLHGREVRPRRDAALAADPQRHRQRR